MNFLIPPAGPAPSPVAVRYQAVEAPRTATEFHALLAAGRLVSLDGKPLRGAPCADCGGTDYGSTCPWSVACPSCQARPGVRCRRPSEHQAPELHAERVLAAEQRDLEREAQGDPNLPAPWLPAPTPTRPDVRRGEGLRRPALTVAAVPRAEAGQLSLGF